MFMCKMSKNVGYLIQHSRVSVIIKIDSFFPNSAIGPYGHVGRTAVQGSDGISRHSWPIHSLEGFFLFSQNPWDFERE